ncbi:hypothetical protein SB775_30735, partial [Peribacillus sp. SIMBA_075]|uniref:hypothetical protein n=1 Tax=Peribacillus sp. SIMBA_075 TaxID=3085813 RepID=UPI00397D14A9
RFLSQFPAARARVDKLSQEVANIIGADLDELRRIEAATALGKLQKFGHRSLRISTSICG